MGCNARIGSSRSVVTAADSGHNHAVARYSVLHDSEQIFAARYVTYLPTVEELERELLRERQLIESQRAGEGA